MSQFAHYFLLCAVVAIAIQAACGVVFITCVLVDWAVSRLARSMGLYRAVVDFLWSPYYKKLRDERKAKRAAC